MSLALRPRHAAAPRALGPLVTGLIGAGLAGVVALTPAVGLAAPPPSPPTTAPPATITTPATVSPATAVSSGPSVTVSPSATIVVPQAPTMNTDSSAAHGTYTIPRTPGVDYAVNGVPVDPATYGTPQPIDGRTSLYVVATPQPGYAFPDGAITRWTLVINVDPLPGPTVTVTSEFLESEKLPTMKVSWSAPGAATYDVSYHKTLANGSSGPELPWLTHTTTTSANFILPAWGGSYLVTVEAHAATGDTVATGSTLLHINIDITYTDITTGVGTFNAAWQQLSNLMATQRLPYYADTVALGYRDARWTVTLPAGTSRFELYATVFDLGARGKILVNGRNWADFETNTSYWGRVDDPYMYPVRTIQGWDDSKPVTITVLATDAGMRYLALDAFTAY